MNDTNKPTVWVVFADKRKDMSKAEQFGQLRDVFSNVGRNYIGEKLIDHAHTVLCKANPGDYLLMVGDPTLCAICLSVMIDYIPDVTVLRWDRDNFEYKPLELTFY